MSYKWLQYGTIHPKRIRIIYMLLMYLFNRAASLAVNSCMIAQAPGM